LIPLVTILSSILLTVSVALAQTDNGAISPSGQAPTEVAPVQPVVRPIDSLVVTDLANDDGGEVQLRWVKSPDDIKGGIVTGYRILKAVDADSPFVETGDLVSGSTSFEGGGTEDGRPYYFKVRTIATMPGPDSVPIEVFADSRTVGPVFSSVQYFNQALTNVAIATAIVIALILFWIWRAQSGKEIYIRKIAGLNAVDEAIGRATEMGKKVMYVPGIDDMDNLMTISSMVILGYVAEMTATYDTYLEVPTCKSMVMVTAKEVVKEAYAKVGRPDSYREDQVHYLTDDQFGYAAAIDGIVVREKPATMFYIGSFYAESLILAEIGNAAGAIQIAGTAQPTQLPFFVTACDYTLLGEEMFAASAYLSKEPRLLGSLKGQDYAKVLILAAILVGLVCETFGLYDFSRLFTVVQ
jgi:hypothetical protein